MFRIGCIRSQKKEGTKSAPKLQISPGKTTIQGVSQLKEEKYEIFSSSLTAVEVRKGALSPILGSLPWKVLVEFAYFQTPLQWQNLNTRDCIWSSDLYHHPFPHPRIQKNPLRLFHLIKLVNFQKLELNVVYPILVQKGYSWRSHTCSTS